MEKIYNAINDCDEKYIVNILIENGIHPYVVESGSGQYLKIVAGYSLYGKDIYVEEKDIDKAYELIKQMEVENYDLTNEDCKKKWYENRILAARIIIGIILLQILVFVIMYCC